MKALLAILIVCLSGVAVAHPLDTGYLRVETKGRDLAITFDLDAAVAAQELHVEAGAVDQALATRATELAGKLYRAATPMVGGQSCTWGAVTGSRKGTTATLVDTASCPPGELRWDLSFVKRLGATYQILGKTIDGEVETVITIDKATTSLTMARASTGSVLTDGIWSGVEHVGLLPRAWHGLPQGFECLLLALLLLLGGGGLKGQLTRAWMLVVGHAIGLTIATMAPDLVMAAPFVLMAAIAAVAASIATGKLDRHRWLLATIAGGAHGAATMDFAHPIGFVAGFAIAQLAIAIVIGPLLGMLTAPEDLAKKLLPPLAIALGGGAIYGVVRWL